MKKGLFSIILFLLVYSSLRVSAQNCEITGKANDILPDKLCAPVDLTWEVTYRGVNDAGTSVQIQVNWDDGNALEIQNAINTNPALAEWTCTFSHTYPIGGDKCNYRPEAMLVVNGVVCTSSIQIQNVTVWDTDDYNGGRLQISPEVFEICVGNADGTNFEDVSIWNCTPAGGENDNINNKKRWTQWIYGTDYTINGVTVGGVTHVYPYVGAIVETSEPIESPALPNSISEYCWSPATAQVGQYFEVTLRNWNTCNPYDDPTVPGPPADPVNGDFPPIETQAWIMIVDTPDVSITPVGPFCENDNQVWLQGTPSGGVWSGSGVNNSGRFRPWVAGPGTHTISYTVTDPTYGCNATATIQIQVFDAPETDILPGANAEVCPGDVLHIDGNVTPGGAAITSHLWTGDVAYLNATDIEAPDFTTNTQGTYYLTYKVEDAQGCSASDNISVTVNPVSANIIPDPAEICVGEDLSLDGNPSGGTGNYTTHLWTGDVSYLDATNSQTVTFNSSSTGTYNLSYSVTDNNGCSGNDNIQVTVFENPVADAGNDDSVCGLEIDLSANPSIGTGTWTQHSGPGTLSFDNIHSATTSVTADTYGLYELAWTESFGAGCVSTDIIQIRFTEQPNANAGLDGGICGYTYQLEAVPSVGSSTWSVLSGVGNLTFDDILSPTSEITSDVYGDYQLLWTEDNGFGCIDTDTVVVSFNLVPVPAFSPIDTSGCTPFKVNFVNQSTGETMYHWDFGNGNTSTLENPQETFVNTGNTDVTYEIELIVNNPGCGDTIKHSLTVFPSPEADFIHDGLPACSPLEVNFTGQSTGAVSNIWNFQDGSPLDTSDNISHVFVNQTAFPVTFDVEMIAVSANGCRDTSVNNISVYSNPEYTITVTPGNPCHPEIISFQTQATGQTYAWDFGNGTSLLGSYVEQSQYTNFGTTDTSYNIELIVTSQFGCKDTANTQVTVHPSPTADFIAPQTTVCAPSEALFVNTSSGHTSAVWSFGDGDSLVTMSDSVYHVFQNNTNQAVTYYIDLIVANDDGCETTIQKTILVYPKVFASFTADTISCNPLNNQMVNFSVGAVSYHWDFGDGTTSSVQNPIHIYQNSNSLNDTVFKTVLTSTSMYGCASKDSLNIRVLPTPLADFILAGEQGCTPYTQVIQNNSQGADTCFWNFGDGTTLSDTSSEIQHIYLNNQANAVDFTIELTATNNYNCTSSIGKTIEVFPKVTANFNADTVSCHPFDNQMLNTSLGAVSYHWDFGDGESSVAENPSHVYNNSNIDTDVFYSTILTATSSYGCTSKDTLEIHVLPTPLADFTLAGEQGCTPYTQIIQNNSQGADTCFWNFGDGSTLSDTSSEIQHVYLNNQANAVDFTIALTAINNYNCTSSISKTIEVFPKVTAGFNADTVSCHPFDNQILNTSLGAVSYHWDFGDGESSVAENPSHVYNNPNIDTDVFYSTILTATSSYGCTSKDSLEIRVLPNPVANFSLIGEQGCTPYTQVIQNNSQGADSYIWSFGDGTSSSESDSVLEHTYINNQSNPVNFTIELTATNSYNCTSSISKLIEVFPKVTANFNADEEACHPFNNQMINLSSGAESYHWDFGDASSSVAENPSHVYNNPNIDTTVSYNTILTATSSYGCTSKDTLEVRVLPKPIANFTLVGEQGCTPYTQIIQNNSQGADSYIWDFGDGTTSTESGTEIEHTYINNQSSAVNFTINLTVENNYSCQDELQKIINTYPKVTALFTSDTIGCSPLLIDFVNISSGADSYYWIFENNGVSTIPEPSVNFKNMGFVKDTIDIRLIAESVYQCKDTLDKQIVVYPQPKVLFDVQPVEQVYPNTTVILVNQSTQGSWNWVWDFGDGETSDVFATGSHSYQTWGEYDIWLKAYGELCSDSAKKTIEIKAPKPTADFSFEPHSGCSPLKVIINNLSVNGENYFWDFGDGSTSEAENPMHTYYDGGIYYIHLTVTGANGTDEKHLGPIEVHQTPEAHIEVSPYEVFIPDQPVKCFNLSVGEDTVIWNFGDGQTSSENNPIHYYQEEGEYQISLVALTQDMCSDTAVIDKNVIAKAQGVVDFPNAFKPSTSGPGDGSYPTPDTENMVFHPVFQGVIEYELNIYNRWGELIFVSKDINIGWDGYYKGKLCKQDVYVWKVKGRYVGGKQFVFAGDVTLLR